jgi:hypothetical protein
MTDQPLIATLDRLQARAQFDVGADLDVRTLRTGIAELTARAEAAEARVADAVRWQFCCEREVFPVKNQSGDSWTMFVAVNSSRRSSFHGPTPNAAIDAAIDALAGQPMGGG